MWQEKKSLSETKRQNATENIEDNLTIGKQEEFLKQHKKSESTETNIMQKDTRPTEIMRSSEAKSDGIKHLNEKEMEEKPKPVEDETSNLESRFWKVAFFFLSSFFVGFSHDCLIWVMFFGPNLVVFLRA